MIESAQSLAFQPLLQQMIATGTTGDGGGPISGASTVNNLIVLRNMHLATRASDTLEVGLAYGASALVFAQTHQDLGHAADGRHIAIDPFQTSDLDRAGLLALDKAGLRGFVTHAEDFSDQVLPALVPGQRRFGLIYIDGSHLFEDVFLDVHYCLQLLEVGGVMLLDDSSHPDVAKVVRFIRRNMGGLLEPVDLAPYRADRGQSAKYRVGSALGRVQLTGFRKLATGRRRWDAVMAQF